MLNVSYRKTGVIHFLKVGRLNISFCLSKAVPGHAWHYNGRRRCVLAQSTINAALVGLVLGAAIFTMLT